MPVREFELSHGAVLTKLGRSDRPLTLRMIETRPGDAWWTYRVNDAVSVLIKHSLNPRSVKREKAKTWQFVFSPGQMRQLQAPGLWAALVCGGRTIGETEMEVCLLDPNQLEQLVNLSSVSQQSLTVKRIDGRGLRASSVRVHDDLIISRSRLDDWEVPGSRTSA